MDRDGHPDYLPDHNQFPNGSAGQDLDSMRSLGRSLLAGLDHNGLGKFTSLYLVHSQHSN